MRLIINSDNIETILKNLTDYAKKPTPIGNINIIKLLEINKETSSSKLNDYLNRYSNNFLKPFMPLTPSKMEQDKKLQNNLLKSTTNPSSDLLTYKGINLGSAINMKLSVQLASLLKDKDL